MACLNVDQSASLKPDTLKITEARAEFPNNTKLDESVIAFWAFWENEGSLIIDFTIDKLIGRRAV